MLSFIKALFMGMNGALSFSGAPLYRYPYRNGGEALRGDWLKLGRDIESAIAENES